MIQGTSTIEGNVTISAEVPLTEMFGYSTDLRSRTQGQGAYSMEFAHYAPVTKAVADEIISGKSKK